jgi:hypothetical protein
MTDSTSYQFGKYRVETELGRGGFGAVFQAVDTTLDRIVALKILDPLLMQDTTWVMNFRREARVMARLEHPHIVPIYEIGEEAGRLYIAMKLIEGGNLAPYIRKNNPLPWEETVRILQEIAAALDFAHEQQVIHRDLKPGNVLLGVNGTAVLTDFGFARLVNDNSMSVSISGGIVGTPAYIAPEVWEGKTVDKQADIYALGCILYEMATGQALFQGDNTPAIMMSHFQPLSMPASWPTGIPAGIKDVLQIALNRDPAARYHSAGEMARDLLRLTTDRLAEPYAQLEAALTAQQWKQALDLAAAIKGQNPQYRDIRALEEKAITGQEQAKRADWAAQWRQQAKDALAIGNLKGAQTAALRWQEMTPGDKQASEFLAQLEQAGKVKATMAPAIAQPPQQGRIPAIKKPASTPAPVAVQAATPNRQTASEPSVQQKAVSALPESAPTPEGCNNWLRWGAAIGALGALALVGIAVIFVFAFSYGCSPTNTQVDNPVGISPTAAPTAAPTPEPTPVPTAEPTPEVTLGVAYTSEFMGLTFEHPADWAVEDFFFIFMASSEEILTAFFEDDGPPESMDNDAVVIMYSGTFDEFGDTSPVGLMDEVMAEFDILESSGRMITPPTAVTINNRPASYAIAEGEAEDGYLLSVFYGVIVDEALERVAVFVGVTSPVGMTRFEPTFRAILETIEIQPVDIGSLFGPVFSDAANIFVGVPQTGTVTEEGPAHFVFFAFAGDVVNIIVDPIDGFDAVIDVLDAEGNSILPGEVDQSFGREEIRNLVLEETGGYFIAVRGFAGETGSFEITLEEADDVSALTGPGMEIFVMRQFEAGGSDWFLFSAEAGTTLTAVVDPLGDLDAVVSIVDYDTDEVLLEVDFSFGQETLTFEPDDTRLYYLVIEGYSGEAGEYYMTVTLSPGILFELVDGALVYGWYDEESRHEFVVFLDEGQTLYVDIDPDGFDVVAEVTDLDDVVLTRMDDGFSGDPEMLTFVAPASDVYLVVSRAFSTAVNGRYIMFISILD